MAKKNENKPSDLIEMEIRVLNERYYKDDWGVYQVEILSRSDQEKVKPKTDESTGWVNRSNGDTTMMVGSFDHRLYPEDEYDVHGTFEYNVKYKTNQFKVAVVRNRLNTPSQIRAFLSICTKSDKIIDQLLCTYGENLVNDFVDGKVDYNKINGMGPVLYETIRSRIMENLYLKDIVAELSPYNISTSLLKRIIMRLGPSACQTIRKNPYRLCDFSGIGFKKADSVAMKMGISPESEFRIREAVKYVLKEAANQGHTWVDRSKVLEEAHKAMAMTCRLSLIENELNNGVDESVVIINGTRVALKKYYDAENYIAEYLVNLLKCNYELDIDVDKYVEEVRIKYPTLTEEQIQLFYNVAKNRINLLIGYAGVGKSFITKLVIDMLSNKNILLLAPTGKASRVLSDYSGIQASTIHRAIGLFSTDEDDEDGNAKNLSYADIVDVDEMSMGDAIVTCKLLKALANTGVRLLLTGDDFQIPSVGAGNLLHDMRESKIIPVTRLTKVFRQADGGILDIATKVRQNEKFIEDSFPLNLPMDDDRLKYGQDAVIHPVSQEYMLNGVLAYYEKALGQFSQDDVVILSPTKMGNLGTYALNKQIQEIVNPYSPSKNQIIFGKDEESGVIFRVGDRVINVKNNYKARNVFDQETTVYNGETGVIRAIDVKSGVIIVDYGFDEIKMGTKSSDLNTIMHAYALTIHKSQGSGFKCVILVMDKAHKFQLNANLVYTGITRTKEQLYLLCQPDVINHAMNKNMPEQRNCFLFDLIREHAKKLELGEN